MANLSQVASATTAATALSNLILVTPNQVIGYQPQSGSSVLGQDQDQRPPTILFHYEGEQDVSLESDITDHYVEDNTALQDQIALRPENISTHGFIGELNDVAPLGLQTLKIAADKLTVIDAYTPALSATALLAYSEATLAYALAANAVNAGVSSWSSLSGQQQGQSVLNESSLIDTTQLQSKQQLYFQQFYGYWKNRVLFTVQTPWGIFSNCAILRLRAVQSEETNVITDFNVVFKVVKFASTQLNSPATNAQGRASAQASGLVDLGTSTPPPNISLSTGLSNNYSGVA